MTARPFDITGPLPSGTTVLEASAGTGKTYTIAGLVTRWIAETDLRLPQLLAVTFTRAATAELRSRVRRRLSAAAGHLEAVIDGGAPDAGDPVLAHLGAGATEDLRRRRARLARALTEFDAATITTIHGFCQHVLDGLGLASDFDRDAELVEDRSELIAEVVDDLLVDTYLEATDRPRVTRDDLMALARVVVANPTTRLVPRDPSEPTAGLRLHLAQRIREEVARRGTRRRQWSYDDLLIRLDATLRDPDRGAAARRVLRRRYRVVLVDEFQDTDPVQWSIVDRAFRGSDDHRALVLIGDPKQAIYAFRGADVHAYLDAREQAGHDATLTTNWRADAGLIEALGTLFAGAQFGEEEIVHRPVDCAPGHDRPGLAGAPRPVPLRLRLLPRYEHLDRWRGRIKADPAREMIARDVAAEAVALLRAAPELVERDAEGTEVGRRPLEPGDVAVLVRRNQEAALVQDRLRAVDVPAVINGVDSVFATPATTDWQRLLDALERPASTSRVRALSLSAWVGWTGAEVAGADEEAWERLHEDVHRWSRLVRERGVAGMQRVVTLQRGLRPRLLSHPGGERRLADLEHIGELLHATASAEHLGPAALAGWLRERVGEASDDQRDERLRRLETDDDAVQILTVHRSKGLEFPVVLCPYLWSANTEAREAPVFHGDDRRRRIDVGGPDHPAYADHVARAEREACGEELRLAYVAMTRARHQVIAHWAPAGRPEWSPLGRLLHCRAPDGSLRADEPVDPLPDDDRALAGARALAERSSGTIGVEVVPGDPSSDPWRPPARAPARLDVARLTRGIDQAWRRTSYSALVRVRERPGVGSEPDEPVKADEALPEEALAPAATGDPGRLRDIPVPLDALPGGVEVGTFVHRVLERTDFTADDLEAELTRVVTEQLARRRLSLDVDLLVAGLAAAVRTPLDEGLALRSVTPADRRDEVAFELPLHRTGSGPATVGELADLVSAHLAADDPLRDYADGLPDRLRRRDLRGWLAGSIDLVLRRDDGAFLVVDHKTNRLAPFDEPLTLWHYRPEALRDAMVHGHYPLQALLYVIALHRYLRWRLPGYDPARHLGGVRYLFLRGMTGPDAPAPDGGVCGVFPWDPPAPLITAASDLLHGAGR